MVVYLLRNVTPGKLRQPSLGSLETQDSESIGRNCIPCHSIKWSCLIYFRKWMTWRTASIRT